MNYLPNIWATIFYKNFWLHDSAVCEVVYIGDLAHHTIVFANCGHVFRIQMTSPKFALSFTCKVVLKFLDTLFELLYVGFF